QGYAPKLQSVGLVRHDDTSLRGRAHSAYSVRG
ncbi:MAG: hypothetical protein QOF97_835, partial [Acidimicrobiaceae bacterium]